MITPAKDVPSPCIGLCAVTDEICTGCYRTLDEITAWFTASPAGKRAILRAVARRESALQSDSVRSK